MLLGLVTAWYFYIRSPETPKQLAEDHQALYRFLLNKWYFDELYDFIFVRPAKWLGSLPVEAGRHGASLTVTAPTALPRGCRTSPAGLSNCRPDTSTTTPS
jgi:NADH:ubiquinone oxidoreductase subunit 5 (subunit L)/multisubunit Na+/H+ antiporter MnhA subunit